MPCPKSLVNSKRGVHKREVWQISLTPDLKRLVSAGRDKSLSVYDFDTNLKTRVKVPDQVSCFAMLQDKELLIACDEAQNVKLYDTTELKLHAVVFTKMPGGKINAICAGQKSVAIATQDGQIKVLGTETMEV